MSEARAREAIARAQQERDRILLEARNREAQNARAQAASAQARADSAEAQAASAQAQAENAQEQAENAQAQAEQARSQLAQAQQELAELHAKKTDRGMVVTLGDVLFDTGQATLKPGAELTLDRLAQYLKTSRESRLLIEGHTDSVGSDDYNQALSERRAQSVATALASRGVAPEQLQTRGLGKDFPVASNATAAGRQQNRRVEIVFSDASGHFAQAADSAAQH